MENVMMSVLIARRTENVDPYVFLAELFDFAHLPQLQLMLQELFDTTIADSWQTKSTAEREDMILFVRKVEGLLAIAHTIHEERTEAGRLYQ
jgi:hypothetical protein